jgi:hypothetical protein
MLLVLAYSLSEGLDILDKCSGLSLSLILSNSTPFFNLLDIFKHLFLLLDKLLFELFKLHVDYIELFFVLKVRLSESVRKLPSFCDKKLAVVFCILIRVHKLLL